MMKKNLQIHKIDISSSLPLPYADEGVRAGFQAQQDYMEQAIDLTCAIIKNADIISIYTQSHPCELYI